ncbi:MAG: hypothetical protein NTX45_08330 [Proteobacteria bacterium]|nr:hypothetical protein [Pseudomonadota bacterium]
MTVHSKIDLFIHRMLENEEQLRWGVELLLKRKDFTSFFDPLQEAGLFAAERSPGPSPAKEPSYLYIPYWPVLDYLEACAKQAGELPNLELAYKIMTVIRKVSGFASSCGTIRENHHTSRKFAEILGLLPNEVSTLADMDLVERWLADRFDHGLVCHTLDKGAMYRFLGSECEDDWGKALRITFHCTALTPEDDKGEVHTVVDDHWLKKFIGHHAQVLGQKLGEKAAAVFHGRLQEVFGKGSRFRFSYLFRAAVEEHPQNHVWNAAENCMVEGLRDLLLGWIDTNTDAASEYVKALLADELEIARRIALHVIDNRWSRLSNLFEEVLRCCLFEGGHRHELYWLLSNHFAEMMETQQASVIKAIRNLPVHQEAEDQDYSRRACQRAWLSAIIGKGCKEADQWFAALGSGENAVGLSKHPDLLSYIETSWGSGHSPYQIHELIAFAKDGCLIEALNNFQPTGRWDEPSIESLVSILEEAVQAEPILFLQTLFAFLKAQPPYQYGILSGFKKLWDKPASNTTNIDWDNAWEQIIKFLEELLSSEGFWTEDIVEYDVMTPNRNWIPPMVADLLHAGSRNDLHAYAPDLLPKSKELIELLLVKVTPENEVSDDPMTQAINSAKGKAIEALFSLALRVCRLADQSTGSHNEAWEDLKPIFDNEMSKCKESNYEFSTLAAAYLANLEYLDANWLAVNIGKIFPEQWPGNFHSAIGGLVYAQSSHRVYALLLNANVVERGLRSTSVKPDFKTRLIERVALAYLWGEEELHSPRFQYWFDARDEDALKAISYFFWSVSNESLTVNQIERIKMFWMTCLEWGDTQRERPRQLLSSLSKLACYIEEIGESEFKLLAATAPYCELDYNTEEFIEKLDQLTANNSKEVYQILMKLLETHVPTYDYESRLLSVVQKLTDQGLREEAMLLADKLRQLPGMRDLYRKVSNT